MPDKTEEIISPQKASDVVVARVKQKIGEMILTYRRDASITQGQLATAMGLSPQTIRDWESGRREPSTARITEIGQALDKLSEPKDTRSIRRALSFDLSTIATEMADAVSKWFDPMNSSDRNAGTAPAMAMGEVPFKGFVETEERSEKVEPREWDAGWDKANPPDEGVMPFARIFSHTAPFTFAVQVKGRGLVPIGIEPESILFVDSQGAIKLGEHYLAKTVGEFVVGSIEMWEAHLVFRVSGQDEEQPQRLGLVLGPGGEPDSAEVLGVIKVVYGPLSSLRNRSGRED